MSGASRVIAIVDLQTALSAELTIEAALERALEQRVGAVMLRAKGVEARVAAATNWGRLSALVHDSSSQLIVHESVYELPGQPLVDARDQHWSGATLWRHAAPPNAVPSNAASSDANAYERTGMGALLEPDGDISTSGLTPSRVVASDCADGERRIAEATRIGVSAHSFAELELAERLGASWALLSPFMPTSSKPGYGPTLGISGMTALCKQTGLPVFALAGVNAETVKGLGATGAVGVAVMGMLTHPRAAEEFQRLFQRMEDEPWSRQTPW